MTYNDDSHIISLVDVETFFHHIVLDRKVNFHPDNMFEEYVSYDNGRKSFTSKECELYNRLMKESFSVCEKCGADIYEIGMNELCPSTDNYTL